MGIRHTTSRVRALVIGALAASLLAGGVAVAGVGGAFSTDNNNHAAGTTQASDTIANVAASQNKAGTSKAKKMKKCEGSVVGLPGRWVTKNSPCSFIGGKKTTTLTYELWGDKMAGQQRGAVEVFGISPQGKSTWYKAGTISGGAGSTTRIKVPWGNSAATPKIRVKSISPAALAAKVNFAH